MPGLSELRNPKLEQAISYADKGWRVLALGVNSKIPVKDTELQPNGSLSATTDKEQIKKLWKLYPKSNIGIATGKESNLTVVDFDEEMQGIVEKHQFSPPVTTVVKTPRGGHVYLPYDPELKQSAGLIEHIDVRNDGGYVVAPGSEVDGKEYKFIWDKPLVEWPEIRERLEAARSESHSSGVKGTFTASDSPSWVSEALINGAKSGQRNDMAARLAGYFRSINLAKDIALASMKQFAENCDPPLDYSEMRQALESVWRYLPSRPSDYKGINLDPAIVDISIANKRVFRWPDSDVLMSCDRITDSSNGLNCIVRFGTSEAPNLYGPVRVNLYSASARDALVRQLKQRAERNWLAIIDNATALIVDSIDGTENLIDLAGYKPSKLTGWSVRPFVRDGLANMIYGDGGAGKSTIVAAILLSKAIGRPVIPGIYVEEPGPVMMADWETTPDEFYYTCNALLAGVGWVGPTTHPVLYRHYGGPLTDHLHSLQRDISDHEVTLVGVDSIVPASGLDVTDAEAARVYFSAVNELGVASLGITHVAKGQDLPYGSVYWNNLSRNNWQVQKEETAGDNIVGAHHKKGNRTGGLHKPLAWNVLWESDTNDNPERITYETVSVHDFAELDKGASAADRIMAYLKTAPEKLPHEVAEALDLKAGTVRTNLRRGTQKGMYTVDATGRYSVNSTLKGTEVEEITPEPEVKEPEPKQGEIADDLGF